MQRHSFYGLGVDEFSLDELEKMLLFAINNKQKKILYGYSMGTIPYLIKIPEIYKYGEKSDILITDGRLFYLMCKYIKKIPLKSDISIPLTVYLLLSIANKTNKNVYLLGADEATNNKAKSEILSLFPNIKSCLGHHGYFQENEYNKIINDINLSCTDILLIGITSPTKEIIAYNWKNLLNVGVIVPCGGMIDVLAGKSKLTPYFFKKLGLASVYRLLQEPKRLFKRYLFIYSYILFKFLPRLIWNVFIIRNKHFSVIEHIK